MTHPKISNPDMWKWHDIYYKSVSYSRVVTRSQTGFNRIVIRDEECDLFCDRERHQPPNLPHLMFTMKDGVYGAIPRTIITRSTSQLLGISPILSKTIEAYKTFYPMIHAGILTHGHDGPEHMVPDNKVYQQTERQPVEPMDQDHEQQLPLELLMSHGHGIVSTPPEVLRQSLASMRYCYDEEQLIPESDKNHQKSPETYQKSPETYQEPLEIDQEPIETDKEPVETKQEPIIEIEQDPIETDKEPIEVEHEPGELEQESMHTEQAPIEIEQAPIEIEQEPIEIEQEPIEIDQEPIDTDQDLLQTDQERIETERETLENDPETHNTLQESFGTDQGSLELESTPTSADEADEESGSTSKPKRDGLRFLHDLLDTMSDRPNDDHLYKSQEDIETEQETLENDPETQNTEQESFETDQGSLELRSTRTLATDSSPDESDEESAGPSVPLRDHVRFLSDFLDTKDPDEERKKK